MTVMAPHGIRPLTDREFRAFQSLVESLAGIHLGPAKKALLVGRLARRLRTLEMSSFGEYFERVTNDPDERRQMLDALCTHETHFFREPRQFEYLEREVYPRWRREAREQGRPKRVRVWSAACSSGEEPYTLAISLLTHLPPEEGWAVEVVATDLSTRILERAQSGLFPIERAAEIPAPLLKRFMLRGTGSQAGKMKAGPELRAVVRFARVNLQDQAPGMVGPFDLIFCRNVLIYFGAATKAAVISRLLDRLDPSGLLFLGHAETLTGISDRVRSVGPTVYRLRS